jgi:phosphatidylglycerophosphate synthase
MAALVNYLDLLATIFFLVAWGVLVVKDIYQGKSTTDPLAVFLFMLGAVTLSVLQFLQNREMIFIVLDIIIAILAVTNWIYIPHRFAKAEREVKRAEKKLLRRR